MSETIIIKGYWKKTSKKPSLTITLESDEYGSSYTGSIEREVLSEIQRAFGKVEVTVN